MFTNKFISKLFRIIFSQVVNSKIKIPFKRYFFRYLLKKYNVKNTEDCILIFHEGWFDKDISKCIRSKYSNVTSVLYFDDTIETYAKSIPSLKPYELKKYYDYVMTYDPSDASKYGFIKCSACFSKIGLDKSLIKNTKSDLCFIGQPKDRYSLLLAICNHIKDRCSYDFIVVGDKDGNDSGICLTKQYMTYEQYLSHEISSNCILEILKGDTQGATFRCWEAVYYNKKLLTNWKGITSFRYYNPKYMRYFEKPEDIDIDFLVSQDQVDYHYKGENSPITFLNNLKKIINAG